MSINENQQNTNFGNLYIVATPIGNLSDITFRAIEVLKSVDLILTEDTRRALKLLNHYNIKKPIESFFVGNEKFKSERIINMLENNKNIALISESGTPCISDPGNYLVNECHKKGITVIPIPGPSAFVTALSVSGIANIPTLFLGFLPKTKQKQNKIMKKIKEFDYNIIFYESPHRLLKTLNLLKENFGNIKIFLFKELTKKFESIIIDNIDNIFNKFDDKVKGEYVILFNKNIF